MKKYTISFTTSYFDDESDDLEKDYLKNYHAVYSEYKIVELIAEVIENQEHHVSGLMSIEFNSKNVVTAKIFVENLIDKHYLLGECWSLKNDKNKQIATEENY